MERVRGVINIKVGNTSAFCVNNKNKNKNQNQTTQNEQWPPRPRPRPREVAPGDMKHRFGTVERMQAVVAMDRAFSLLTRDAKPESRDLHHRGFGQHLPSAMARTLSQSLAFSRSQVSPLQPALAVVLRRWAHRREIGSWCLAGVQFLVWHPLAVVLVQSPYLLELLVLLSATLPWYRHRYFPVVDCPGQRLLLPRRQLAYPVAAASSRRRRRLL